MTLGIVNNYSAVHQPRIQEFVMRGAVLPEGRQYMKSCFNADGGGGGGGGGGCSPLRAIYGGGGAVGNLDHHSRARILY